MTKVAIANDEMFYYIPKFRSPVAEEYNNLDAFKPYSDQDAADFEAVRKKLMSRVFAIDKLLERYRKVLSEEQVEGIESSLNELRKKVRKLKLASVLNDTIVKTANILKNKYEFGSGAELLYSLAQEPVVENDTSVQTEAQQRELQDILEKLYIVSSQLKNKRVIRDLAELDLRLYQIGMSSFFPELTEAQAKLIDAFGYASNKVEDILPKIQGSLVLTEAEEAMEQPEQDLAQEVKTMSEGIEVPQKEAPEMEMTVPAR